MTTGQKILSQLQGLEDKGNGRYRSHSPLRAGSDSPSFSLYLAPDGEHGMFKDFVSDEAGSLYDLARHMQIELPTIQIETGKRSYKDLAEYAEAHGVSAAVFRAAKWREGVLGERPVLFFETSQGQRWRFMDGRKPKYGNKKGYQTCWYGLKRAVTLAIKSGFFILCNGEASSVVAQHYGLGAACLTNSGERAISDFLNAPQAIP